LPRFLSIFAFQTPLHVSCIVDNPSITRLLLQANPSSCDVTDRHGNNCVHLATKHSSETTQFGTLSATLEIANPTTLEKKNLYGKYTVTVDSALFRHISPKGFCPN